MKILLDYDDVLVSCNQVALDDINKCYGTNYQLEDINSWGSINTILDERMKYFTEKGFVRLQPVFDGAVNFVKNLQLMGDVWICTAVHENCTDERIQHILSHFPVDIDHIIICNDKSIIKTDVRIDDKVDNLKGKAQIKILWDKPWNKKCEDYLRFNNYDNVINYLTKLLEGGMLDG